MTEPTETARQMNAALTALAEYWEWLADIGDTAIGQFEGPTAATLDAEVGERSRTYRRVAADVREVQRTGRLPHDLVTAADMVDPLASPTPSTDRAALIELIERKDREYATCERLLREAYQENARLRERNPQDEDEPYAELLRTAEPTAEASQDEAGE